jgi:hypothetical protein
MTQPKAKAKAKRKVHPAPKPRKPNKPKDPVAEMAKQMAEHQKMMAKSMADYAEMVENSQAAMQAMTHAINSTGEPPPPKAEAQWTEAGGNKFLVLNEAAAAQFMSIFDVVSALAEQLKKL